MLLEPTTVVAKAWDHIERIGARARWQPAQVLVTGAGPIGLLAALLGVQRGLEVHVLDRAVEGLKPDLVAALGATYHHTSLADAGLQPDVVIECTGASQVILDAMEITGNNGIVCLTGVSSAHELPVDVGMLNRRLVLSNDVVFGSVNANRRHYEMGAAALAARRPGLAGPPDLPPGAPFGLARRLRAPTRRRQGGTGVRVAPRRMAWRRSRARSISRCHSWRQLVT